MKKFFFTAILCTICAIASAQVSQIVGDWKTIDDKTGEARSTVHIYKATDGKYYGKITSLIGKSNDEICVPCEGEDHNKPVVGLVIIRQMEEKNGELVGGRVLDPESGNIYYAKISLKEGRLVLRGSLDKRGILGRNQTWIRLEK